MLHLLHTTLHKVKRYFLNTGNVAQAFNSVLLLISACKKTPITALRSHFISHLQM